MHPYFVENQLVHLRKVEVQVAYHCNLTCKGCVHGSPGRPKRLLQAADFAKDLAALGTAARVHKLVLLGGEPLLHPDLIDLLKLAHASGVAKYVCVVSNGIGLEKMPDDFFRHVDVLEISRYPKVRLRFTEDDLARKAQQFGFQFAINNCNQFQETMLTEPMDQSALVSEIYGRCKQRGEWSCHTFAEGRYYMCSRSPILAERLNACGQSVDNRHVDSIPMRDNPRLFDDLVHYLRREQPLEACKWCLGSDGADFAHILQGKAAAIAETTRLIHFSPERLNPRARAALAHLLEQPAPADSPSVTPA